MKRKSIPFILPGNALNSLRDSGYSLAAALGEPIDNALEADANEIRILFEEERYRGKKHIHRISIIDDGAGMSDDTLHHYLQLGFSTRYMSTTTLGKYGVGAKLAALNFGRQIDVWSRTKGTKPWFHVHFDLDEARAAEERGEQIGIEAPQEADPPEFVQDYLQKRSGTVVVWSKVDRLEEGRIAEDANALRVEVEKELSRIFRYFINAGRKLWVNETLLIAHDPLMLMEGTWADVVLAEALKLDGKKKKTAHFPADKITKVREPIAVDGSEAYLTVTVYPKEILRKRGSGGDSLAKKLRVLENQGALSFVRLDREISYTNVPRILPTGVQDPDRFIGIEIAFKPELDSYFGVRNVKRGVEPHGELRNRLRELLRRYIPAARQRIEDVWGHRAREEQETTGKHDAITSAVKAVVKLLPASRVEAVPEEEQEQELEQLADDLGIEEEDARQRFVEEKKDLPVIFESVNFPGTNFLDLRHLGEQVIIRLNTRHRFYRELWEPISEVALSPNPPSPEEAARLARRTIEALSLLLIAYAKAETMHPDPHGQYDDLRNYWGHFLDTLLGKIKNTI